MSHTRTVALFLSLAGLIIGVTQSSSASDDRGALLDGAPSLTLVKADWCNDACNDQCGGDCADAFSVGCTCYWLCGNGEDGHSVCGAAAVPVTICAN